ncbi:uncharacterized protein M6D78_010617 [Vipera latastei]
MDCADKRTLGNRFCALCLRMWWEPLIKGEGGIKRNVTTGSDRGRKTSQIRLAKPYLPIPEGRQPVRVFNNLRSNTITTTRTNGEHRIFLFLLFVSPQRSCELKVFQTLFLFR